MRIIRRSVMAVSALWAGLALIALLSCRQERAAPSFVVLSGHADELRSQFQQDAGAVRVIMLVAPS